GLSSVYKRLDMLDADSWRILSSQRGINILDYGKNTNFQKEIEQTGFTQQHHVAFYGGTASSNYRVSLGYVGDDGIIRTEKNKSFIANMNMNQDMFDGLLNVEIGLFGSTANRNSLFDVQKTLYSAASWNPTFPNHLNQNGEWDGMSSASQINNPFALLEEQNHDASAHISTHAKLIFNILPELKFTLFGAYTYNNDNLSQYLPTIVWNKGQAYQSTDKLETLLGNAIISFKKKFGKHSFDAIALAEIQREKYTGYNVTVTNFSSDLFGYDNLSAGALRPWNGTGSYYEDPRMTSFMGRLNYTFNNRYILTLTARTDGSSKFGNNNKWGFFPSVSGTWILTNEKFMQKQKFIHEMKLNIGYGLAGNQDGIDSYTTMSLVKPNGVTPVGSGTSVSLSTLRNVNPDLKWEVKKNFNIGIDMSMFNGRLLLTANYYNSKTEDMLYPYSVSVPPFTYNILVANIGSMRNRGLELSLGATPIIRKDMELNINANITFQNNKLLSLSGYYRNQYLSAPSYQAIAGLNGAGFHGGYNDVTYQIVGQSLGVFYLPKCSGLVSNGKGGYTYGVQDLNGGGVDIEDGQDRYIAGQAEPKVLLGSNISFRYKDFDIIMQLNGAFGHKIFNGTSLAYMNMSSFPLYNVLSKAPSRNIMDQTVTDYWLESGDYVNIDYITLGWRVPLKSNKVLRSLRLSITMNNVATFTSYSGLSPMINSSSVDSTFGVDDKRTYPLYHTYTFAVSMNF
ncbi:MAG TPA: SusC/RagA family TonB-linked outer membrane protein, partial [Xylanibacter oryzae]|nr:SusC/RagA family TonB-linked outer membrane protein [Xylanibacter oryzae]